MAAAIVNTSAVAALEEVIEQGAGLNTNITAGPLGGKIAHYVKVVHTFILPRGQSDGIESSDAGGGIMGTLFSGWGSDHMEVYQHQVHSSTDATVSPGSQVSLNITYDISPLAYELSTKTSNTAHFLTQLCAIIGGVFTVIGMVDTVIYSAASSLHSMMK